MGERITLKEAIKRTHEAKSYGPLGTPRYNHRGDYISVFFESCDMYSEIVDDVLTIYRCKETHELTGCRICNVTLLAENVANIFGIEDNDVKLRLLLLSAAGTKPARRHYYDVSKKVGVMALPKSQLVAA